MLRMFKIAEENSSELFAPFAKKPNIYVSASPSTNPVSFIDD